MKNEGTWRIGGEFALSSINKPTFCMVIKVLKIKFRHLNVNDVCLFKCNADSHPNMRCWKYLI